MFKTLLLCSVLIVSAIHGFEGPKTNCRRKAAVYAKVLECVNESSQGALNKCRDQVLGSRKATWTELELESCEGRMDHTLEDKINNCEKTITNANATECALKVYSGEYQG